MIADLKPYSEYKDSGLSWLGRVPEHWEIRRTKALLREVDRRSTTGKESLLSLRMQSGLVDHHALGGKIIPPLALVGYKRVLPGEIVMNRMRAAAGLFAAATSEGLVSPDYAIFRPAFPMSVTYVVQLFRTPAMTSVFRLESRGLGTGESGFLRLYSDRFGMLPIPFPPIPEQMAIVRYLDWANGWLERAILAKRKVIALLNEQKQAIIHRAVTRGLDPSVPLKPSGIPWLGDIPQHWEVRRLRHLIKGRLTYGANAAAEFTNPEWPRYIRITDFRVDGSLKADTFRSLPPTVAGDYMVAPGDILLARSGATVGKAFLVVGLTGAACHAGYLIRARPDLRLVSPDFLFAFTQSKAFSAWKDSTFNTATIQNIGADKYANLHVPFPPLVEQQAILDSVAVEQAPLIATVARLEREVELLREYRARLVADVVTGKLDVRETAARLPNEAAPDIVEDASEIESADEEAAA